MADSWVTVGQRERFSGLSVAASTVVFLHDKGLSRR